MKFRKIVKEWFNWYSIPVYPMNELPEHLLHSLRQEQEKLDLSDRLNQKRNHQAERSNCDME